MTWRRAAAFLPGVGVALLPKLTCPMCWPAYAGLLTTLGLGFLLSERYLFGVTALFLLISVGALAFRYRERRGIAPVTLGIIGAATLLVGKFHFELTAAMYAGVSILVAASVWNSWPKRSAQSCPEYAPRGDELIQLSVKGR